MLPRWTGASGRNMRLAMLAATAVGLAGCTTFLDYLLPDPQPTGHPDRGAASPASNRSAPKSTASPGASLTHARNHSRVLVQAGRMLVIGGGPATAAIEVADLAADGSLGAFKVAEGVGTFSAADGQGVVKVGDRLYLVGGCTLEYTPLRAVDEVPLSADGLPGAARPVAGVQLNTGRISFASEVIGSYLYVIGGGQGYGPVLASVERARVNPDGTLGSFAAVATGSLVTARTAMAWALVPPYLYVLGGLGAGGQVLASVERAPIGADGALGGFSTVASLSLPAACSYPAAQVVGDDLYLVGGMAAGPTDLATVVRAPIRAGGELGLFSILNAPRLNQARFGHALTSFGGALYVTGGYQTGKGALSTVERLILQP